MTLQSFFLFGIFHSVRKTLLLVSFNLHIRMEWIKASRVHTNLHNKKNFFHLKKMIWESFCVAQVARIEIFHKQMVISFDLHIICKWKLHSHIQHCVVNLHKNSQENQLQNGTIVPWPISQIRWKIGGVHLGVKCNKEFNSSSSNQGF